MAENFLHVLEIELLVDDGYFGGQSMLFEHFVFEFEEGVFLGETVDLNSQKAVLYFHSNFNFIYFIVNLISIIIIINAFIILKTGSSMV